MAIKTQICKHDTYYKRPLVEAIRHWQKITLCICLRSLMNGNFNGNFNRRKLYRHEPRIKLCYATKAYGQQDFKYDETELRNYRHWRRSILGLDHLLFTPEIRPPSRAVKASLSSIYPYGGQF